VFLAEPPLLDHPLLKLEAVVATPHVAGFSRESLHALSTTAAEQWIGIFEGKVPPRLVNPEAWPRYAERFRAQFGTAPDRLPCS
jgi:D-3-phosphoglycerate dehydrogenase / 2-oxoglutarate reductase